MFLRNGGLFATNKSFFILTDNITPAGGTSTINFTTGGYNNSASVVINADGSQSIIGRADAVQLTVTGHTTQAVGTSFVKFTRNDTAAGVSRMLGLTALGSGADGDGGALRMAGKSSTTADTDMAYLK